jgi:hypothetical protein
MEPITSNELIVEAASTNRVALGSSTPENIHKALILVSSCTISSFSEVCAQCPVNAGDLLQAAIV